MTEYEKIRQWWVEQQIDRSDELFAALNGFCVGFAYHSGKLENPRITYHDTREIFDKNGVVSYTGDLRTLFEIRNEKKAYELFLDAFDQKKIVDEELVKAFQKALTDNTYDERRWRLGHPPVTIHEEDRKGYYDALEIWDRTLDLEPLKEFLRQQCVKTWKSKLQ